MTEEAEGAKDDFCAAGAVDSDGPEELSAAGLKFRDPKGKEVAGAAVVLPTEAGVTDALEEAEEKENVAAPVRAGVWACLEASVAKEYGGGSLPVEPGVFTAEGMKEKTAAPLPAGGWLEVGTVGATAGAASGFREVGGVAGLVAVLPAERQMRKEQAHLAALTDGRRYCKAKSL